MEKMIKTVLIAWLGYWIGANRLIPLWMVPVLAVAGLVYWLVAEWMEREEGKNQ